MKKEEIQDQTSFARQEPVFEELADYDGPKDIQKFLKTKKGRLVLILSSLFGFFLVLIIILYFIFKTKPKIQMQEPEKVAPEIIELDPLRARIKVLVDDLEEADPTKQELPFPPIDLLIRIDPEVR